MIVLHSGNKQKLFEEDKTKITSKEKKNNKPDFIAKSNLMTNIYNKIKLLSNTRDNLLILGDKGTGRRTVAYEVFYNSNHSLSQKNFFELNCKSLSPHLIRQKLFGDKNSSSYKSLLKLEGNNTIYIKNISFLNLETQKQLYDYLVKKVSHSNRPRLICSSTETLSKKIQSKNFLQELFNLLSEDLIILPRLEERKEDIFPLINHFNKLNHFKQHLNQRALEFLDSYSWYGNITELKNVCLKISILYHNKDIITEKELSYIIKDLSTQEVNIQYNPNLTLNDIVNIYTEKALLHYKCKKTCAMALGVSVKTLYNKIKLGLISEESLFDTTEKTMELLNKRNLHFNQS